MHIKQHEGTQKIDRRTINNINFTSRELDIIACLLAGRAAKKTASFLSISPRTVEMHLRNIMAKLGCNSRESIIDFIEKSDKFILIKSHYSNLLIKITFELELKKLQELTKNNNISCLVFHCKKQREKDPFISDIEKHLKLAGIKTVTKIWEKDKASDFIANKIGIGQVNCIIYIISNDFADQLRSNAYAIQEEVANLKSTINNNSNRVVFVLLNNEISLELNKTLSDFICIPLEESKNYYFLVLKLLQKLLPNYNIDSRFVKFKKQYESSISYSPSQPLMKDNELTINNNLKNKNFKYSKKLALKIGIIFLLIVCIGFVSFAATKYILLANKNTMPTKTISKTQQLNTKEIILINLPTCNTKFTGRKKYLKQIETQFNTHHFGIIIQAISGLGGVGKTQLATEFAYEAARRNIYKTILWVTAETPNAINNAYREFANRLQIDIRGLKPNEVQALVHSKLAKTHKNSKLLFILDNAPHHDDIQDYIGRLHKQLPMNIPLHVLITSRSQYWPEKPIMLDDFTPKEALLFIKKHLPDEEETFILHLAKTLHYFPLALSQAVSYIKAHTNIGDYLSLYKAKEKDYLDLFAGEKNQYTESLWKTWYIALSKLSNNAREMLFISAYLCPDEIPITFFDNLSVEVRVKTIENLRKHSFIILTNNNKAFKIHRLLQEVIRTTNVFFDKQKNYGLAKAINLLKNKFYFNYSSSRDDEWNLCGQYLTHAQSLAEHAIKIKNEFLHEGIQLYAQIAMYLTYGQQSNKTAEKTWKKILYLIKYHYSKDKSFILGLANINTHLGFVMRQTGNMNQATKYLEKSILTYKAPIPVLSKNLENLLTYLRWDQSINLYDGIKVDQSFTLLNCGHVKKALADFNGAKNSYEEALVILDKCKWPNSTTIYKVSLLQSLSNLYRHCGNINAAEKALTSAKIIVDKNFPNHVEQAYVYEGLANLQYYMGMYNEAKGNLEKCLKIRLAIHSKYHYRVGYTKSILGLILCANKHIDDGLTILRQAEIIYNKNFERGYFRFIFLYIHMSYAFEMHKEYDEALKYLEKAQNMAAEQWREKTSVFLTDKLTPVEEFPALDASEKNIHYYMHALTLIKNLFGAKHIRVARYYYLLGNSFENIQNKYKAKQYYKEALNIANKQHFDNPLLDVKHKRNIAIIQERLAKLDSSS